MRSILIYLSEQNENLPRYPELSYTQKIPRSPRSVASILSKLKPNSYDRDNNRQHIELQQKIAGNVRKKTKVDTGYPGGFGKLTA